MKLVHIGLQSRVGETVDDLAVLNDQPFQDSYDFSELASHPLDDALGHLLGVAEQHHGVVAVEQGIVDAGIA